MAKPRVILWAHPRSTSCAFMRSMMTIPGMKSFFEPFGIPYFFGPDRTNFRFKDEPIRDDATFMDCKKILESHYPESSCVFIKDIAKHLAGKLGNMDFIPKGFVHTFLIRNPRDSVMSWYDATVGGKYSGYNYYAPSQAGVKELWEMYTLLADTIGERQLFVIDSDDLLDAPELYLREYCRRTGLPFSMKMVEWGEERPEDVSCFAEWKPWLEHVLRTTGLKKQNQRVRNLDDYPDVVREEIDHSLLYYEHLHAKRYTPDVTALEG